MLLSYSSPLLYRKIVVDYSLRVFEDKKKPFPELLEMVF
jgi:hypothetical protein